MRVDRPFWIRNECWRWCRPAGVSVFVSVVVKNGIRMNVNAFIQSISVYAACISIQLFLLCFVEIEANENNIGKKRLYNQYLCTKPRMNIETHMRHYPKQRMKLLGQSERAGLEQQIILSILNVCPRYLLKLKWKKQNLHQKQRRTGWKVTATANGRRWGLCWCDYHGILCECIQFRFTVSICRTFTAIKE